MNVCIALTFMFTIFAIFGVNFFVGEQYNFCRATEELIDDGVSDPYWPMAGEEPILCATDEMCANSLGPLALAKCGNVFVDYGLDPHVVDKTRSIEFL